MNEEMLQWMNRTYPRGFFCADFTETSIADSPLEALSMLDVPLLLHVQASQLQELIGGLIDHGASPNTSCVIAGQNISATLGDVVLKTRGAGLVDLFLVIAE